MPAKIDIEELQKELSFTTARSSGSGGQHVNKVETKVILSFKVEDSLILSPKQKTLIQSKLKNRINKEGVLSISYGRKRSQLKNKKAVLEKFEELIIEALTTQAYRIPSKVPKGVIAASKKKKAIRSKVKALRKKPNLDE